MGVFTYLDSEDLGPESGAEQVRESVRPVEIGGTDNELAIGFSVDPGFFRVYGARLLFYAQQLPAVGFYFFICGTAEAAEELARDAAGFTTALNQLNRTGVPANVRLYSVPVPKFVAEPKTFYACARFFMIERLLEMYEEVAIVDADFTFVENPVEFLRKARGIPFAAVKRDAVVATPWTRVGAGSVVVNRTVLKSDLVRDLQAYLVAGLQRPNSWMLDQNALAFIEERYGDSGEFANLGRYPRPFHQHAFRATWEVNYRNAHRSSSGAASAPSGS